MHRWDGAVSPDGIWLAHRNKDQELWVHDIKTGKDQRVAQSMVDDFYDLVWSPDSQWLAYVEAATNTFLQIKVWSPRTRESHALTTDRYNSHSPAWSSDGKWLYFPLRPGADEHRDLALADRGRRIRALIVR